VDLRPEPFLKLYVVATPIGNLKDITIRAIETLKEVDFILCEDTRETKKILDFYDIKKPLISYHQHTGLKKTEYIVNLLKQDKNLALVSDAGTPGISDPGNKLIEIVVSQIDNLEIVSIPGPSALTAVASICGFPVDKFVFLGFPPHKKGRQKFFKQLAEHDLPVIIYESPHRILKTLLELSKVSDFDIVVAREITKKFETIYRGKPDVIISRLEAEGPKGEFAIVIWKKS